MSKKRLVSMINIIRAFCMIECPDRSLSTNALHVFDMSVLFTPSINKAPVACQAHSKLLLSTQPGLPSLIPDSLSSTDIEHSP